MRLTPLATAAFTCAIAMPAAAQTATETVAFLTLNYVKGQWPNVGFKAESPKRLTITDSRGKPMEYTVTQDSDCAFTITGAKANGPYDAHNMTIDFSAFRPDAVRTKAISDPFNPNGKTTLIYVTGARLCRGKEGSALFNAGLGPGECTDEPPLDALWPDMLARKLKAIKHLRDRFCRGSAF